MGGGTIWGNVLHTDHNNAVTVVCPVKTDPLRCPHQAVSYVDPLQEPASE